MRLRWVEIALIVAVPVVGANAYDLTVRWNDLRQRITGFGANAANGQGKTVDGLSPELRERLCKLSFSVDSGIGLTMIRNEIWWTLQPEPGVWDWTKDSAQIEFWNLAKKYGASYFWSCPWSPPLYMKTIGNQSDGSLKREYYRQYAEYLSRYVREYKERFGIDVRAVSVQNEPHFDPPWQGTTWSGEDIRDFIRDHLGPTFQRDGVRAGIVMPESNWHQRGWSDPTLEDPEAAKYVSAVAFHFYERLPVNPYASYPLAASQGKELWETETMTFDEAPDDPTMNDAMKAVVDQLHGLLTTAELSAWHFWWFVCRGNRKHCLCTMNEDKAAFHTTKRLWCLGNWSKFVRPGWRMIGCDYFSSDSVIALSAFRDTSTGDFAIVAVNHDKVEAFPLTLTLDGFRATRVTPWLTDSLHDLEPGTEMNMTAGLLSAHLPPFSVTTFVGKGTTIAQDDVDVDSFDAKPRYALSGKKVELSWSTQNARSVTLDNRKVRKKGSVRVSPKETAAYTLTAEGPHGPITRKITVVVQTPRSPDKPTAVVHGVRCQYYEGDWTAIPDLAALTPSSTGTSTGIYPRVRGYRPTGYAVRYTGYVNVPHDGRYTFFTGSNHSSKLYIGDKLVVDNDRGIPDERSGSIFLKAGLHAITVDYLQARGMPALSVSWRADGNGNVREPVGGDILFREK